MKDSMGYSFHHQQLHHHQLQQQHSEPDQVLDLSKNRRDSTETRKTTSPSSFEDSSPSARLSPQNQATNMHHPIQIQKQPFTPEHRVQYHYNYEHSSPTTTVKNVSITSPHQIFGNFNGIPILRKQENQSPSPEQKINTSQYFLPSQQLRSTTTDHHDDISNDSPCMTSNISSSSSTASSQKSPSSQMMVVGRDGKLSRPFKAYPRDPLSLAAAGSMLDSSSAEKYSVFRKRMLEQIHAANGGNPVINNPKMRRITMKGSAQETNNNEPSYTSITPTPNPIVVEQPKSISGGSSSGHDKDEAYFERRKKNNAAAKKSRDRRRIKEDEIAIRAAFLERENIELKFELAACRKQLSLYSGLTSN